MLDYLVTSKARLRLVRLLWTARERGSVSDLARRANLSFRSAHKELNGMLNAGLAECSRVGNATVFEAKLDHARADALLALLGHDRATSDNGPDEQWARRVRAWLGTWGAPLAVGSEVAELPGVEHVFAEGCRLAHYDASVARGMPVFVWKNRRGLDLKRLRMEAQHVGEKRAVGFFLELTATLARDRDLAKAAEEFRDHRVRRSKDFFVGRNSTHARSLAEQRTPPVARKWHFRMNVSMDSFSSTFRKFVSDESL